MSYKIHPSVGISRLGNSTDEIYLAPRAIGGLPRNPNDEAQPVTNFKDDSGRIKRQGQLFKVFSGDNELTIGATDPEDSSRTVTSMEWTVHLANKKAAWYQYSELQGNLLYGDGTASASNSNSYTSKSVALRNASVTGESGDNSRQTLIIDPGPRTIFGRDQTIQLDKNNTNGLPLGYPVRFPSAQVTHGLEVSSLGTLKTDSNGRLIVLGGYGHAGGSQPLTSYGGSDSWHDDIADGPVYCKVTFSDNQTETLKAWALVGSPHYAPELVNISTLSDTMFDVAVRCKGYKKDIYENGAFKTDYRVNFSRDIEPIFKRMRDYQWVVNVQPMMAFTDIEWLRGLENQDKERENVYNYFRQPNDKTQGDPTDNIRQSQLFRDTSGDQRFPLMPINAASNPVSNDIIVKFLALNETQYFFLGQWKDGKCDYSSTAASLVDERNAASVGNCVGLPMSPGIEVTWSMQHPNIYEEAYVISDRAVNSSSIGKAANYYNTTGLTPSRDECEGINGPRGCEPGDLTKRMACPWQADFYQCTIQYINFTDPASNKSQYKANVTETVVVTNVDSNNSNLPIIERKETAPANMPDPPTYYSYWWPPHSPWDVLTGELTVEGQTQIDELNPMPANIPAGEQVNYQRGINTFVQMVEHWYALAFIRNRNAGDERYPFFTEVERTHEVFSYKSVPVGQITGFPGDNDPNAVHLPVYFIDGDKKRVSSKGERGKKVAKMLEDRAFRPITVAPGAFGHPRSGTRNRR